MNADNMERVAIELGSATGEHTSVDVTAENRMWTAVLMQAVLEWQSNNARASREAEGFLFNDEKDFRTVCAGAGLNPSAFREHLKRIRRKTTSERLAWRPLAA